ncbi:GIY-YIG nuclease family protein [Pseudomonas putida]|uniref:GIY-YIG nuclease family protein n=1 Tax=Pseudomonas putida TaxID=303 RepID=UPI0023643BD1|nr:GIY-YIG nuclease family protein [Pseudomonas putida]MDD2140266.1 GIY-YIG nuclease family protein [Pseudomonas putida]HDS1725612.1 GIY-YIG nuclease family protein [Pseudomonas putida]
MLRKILEDHEAAIQNAVRISPLASNGWASQLPKEAGVYAIWQQETPVYVGESSSLRLRMADLARPVNHTFTRKIAKKHQIIETNYSEIAKTISANYYLSHIQVEIGRAEIEEYLILRWRNTLLNKPTLRLLHSAQYHWVTPIPS